MHSCDEMPHGCIIEKQNRCVHARTNSDCSVNFLHSATILKASPAMQIKNDNTLTLKQLIWNRSVRQSCHNYMSSTPLPGSNLIYRQESCPVKY